MRTAGRAVSHSRGGRFALPGGLFRSARWPASQPVEPQAVAGGGGPGEILLHDSRPAMGASVWRLACFTSTPHCLRVPAAIFLPACLCVARSRSSQEGSQAGRHDRMTALKPNAIRDKRSACRATTRQALHVRRKAWAQGRVVARRGSRVGSPLQLAQNPVELGAVGGGRSPVLVDWRYEAVLRAGQRVPHGV